MGLTPNDRTHGDRGLLEAGIEEARHLLRIRSTSGVKQRQIVVMGGMGLLRHSTQRLEGGQLVEPATLDLVQAQ